MAEETDRVMSWTQRQKTFNPVVERGTDTNTELLTSGSRADTGTPADPSEPPPYNESSAGSRETHTLVALKHNRTHGARSQDQNQNLERLHDLTVNRCSTNPGHRWDLCIQRSRYIDRHPSVQSHTGHGHMSRLEDT